MAYQSNTIDYRKEGRTENIRFFAWTELKGADALFVTVDRRLLIFGVGHGSGG
jgi:hypothetical protein